MNTLVQDSFVEPCLAALPYSLWGTVLMSVGVPEQLLEEATATGDLMLSLRLSPQRRQLGSCACGARPNVLLDALQ